MQKCPMPTRSYKTLPLTTFNILASKLKRVSQSDWDLRCNIIMPFEFWVASCHNITTLDVFSLWQHFPLSFWRLCFWHMFSLCTKIPVIYLFSSYITRYNKNCTILSLGISLLISKGMLNKTYGIIPTTGLNALIRFHNTIVACVNWCAFLWVTALESANSERIDLHVLYYRSYEITLCTTVTYF